MIAIYNKMKSIYNTLKIEDYSYWNMCANERAKEQRYKKTNIISLAVQIK